MRALALRRARTPGSARHAYLKVQVARWMQNAAPINAEEDPVTRHAGSSQTGWIRITDVSFDVSHHKITIYVAQPPFSDLGVQGFNNNVG